MADWQKNPNGLSIPAPLGIDVNGRDASSAKFIQNLLVNDNKTLRLKHGTKFVSNFDFEEDKIFLDTIEQMVYLKTDGLSELITYTNYLQQLSFLTTESFQVIADENNADNSILTINLTEYETNNKEYIKNTFIAGNALYLVQEIGADGVQTANVDILQIDLTDDKISIVLPLNLDFFDIDNLKLWIERAGLYKVDKITKKNSVIADELAPNVIVTSLSFQQKLYIATGVQPVKVYNGVNIDDLRGIIYLDNSNDTIQKNNKTISFAIDAAYRDFFVIELKSGVKMRILFKDGSTQDTALSTDATFGNIVQNKIPINLTVVDDINNNDIDSVQYLKKCPNFSYIAICHDRFFGLAEGNCYKNKWRVSDLAMRLYYAATAGSAEGWYNKASEIGENEIPNIIPFLDTNSSLPDGGIDNLEAIYQFRDKILIFGRNAIQIWGGSEPINASTIDQITPSSFLWLQTLSIGLFQRKMFIEIPNFLLILTEEGISAIGYNKEGLLEITNSFSLPIKNFLTEYKANLQTDREYRTLRSFLYPFGAFVGFRMKDICFILQVNVNINWVIFTDNFATSNSFCYDKTNRNLYLSNDKGEIIVYADKGADQSYEEYGKGKISWMISYNWIPMGNTWGNDAISLHFNTLKPLTLTMRIFINYNETISAVYDDLYLDQQGAVYDVTNFNSKKYPYYQSVFLREDGARFYADSIKIELSGLSNDALTFHQMYLIGGLLNGGGYGA